MNKHQLLCNASKILHAVLVLSGICCLVALLLKPIIDPDFFWHLKTGEWIIQHHALPSIDPFSINPPETYDPHQKAILTSYWLYQVIISWIFGMSGFTGIIFVRFLLAGGVTLSICRNFKLSIMGSSICILSAILFLKEYTLDRPQTISFVLYLLSLLILFRFIDNRAEGRSTARSAAGMAFIMLAWSNMHGGYLVGQAILLLVCATEGCKFLHQSLRPMSRSRYIRLAGIVSLTLACSFINPNFVNIISQIDSVFALNSLLPGINSEYISVLRKWQETRSVVILLYYIIAAIVVLVALQSYRRADITKLAILLCTGYFGFVHIRYFPFFLIAAVIYILQSQETGRQEKLIKLLVVATTIASIFLCFLYGDVNLEKRSGNQWVNNDVFPVAAVDFLKEHHAQGGIFSNYRWGGYLIWRLSPEMKPFIDSRCIDFKRFFDYSYCEEIIESDNKSDQKCKKMFQDYGINYILINICDSSGAAHPLLYSIGEDPDWALIYDEKNVAVFQKVK
jgi:hypothetical protein